MKNVLLSLLTGFTVSIGICSIILIMVGAAAFCVEFVLLLISETEDPLSLGGLTSFLLLFLTVSTKIFFSLREKR